MIKLEAVLQGDVRSISRLISSVENGDEEGRELLKRLYQHTGKAVVIGITGAPGAGKSTLVNQLIGVYLEQGFKVAVLAIDPSSVFTGGSILGDRIRMPQINKNLYIRSLATRGYLGGLSKAVGSAIKILDAAGYEKIIVETVGTGQSEIDIRNYAHIVLVVTTPNMGDDIQALKAGILEIGDIYVVNKADLSGADKVVGDLTNMIQLFKSNKGEWIPPVLKVIAANGTGIKELVEEIEKYYSYLSESGLLSLNKFSMAERELTEAIKESLLSKVIQKLQSSGQWNKYCSQVANGEVDPWSAAEYLLNTLK